MGPRHSLKLGHLPTDLESAPHIHSPHSGGTTGVSACERTCSTNRWWACHPTPASPAAYSWSMPISGCGPGEALGREPSDSARRCWLAPHPCRPKERIQTVISSRRKGSWVMIGKHWTGSQDLELLHQPAGCVPTRFSALSTKDRLADDYRLLTPKMFYPKML